MVLPNGELKPWHCDVSIYSAEDRRSTLLVPLSHIHVSDYVPLNDLVLTWPKQVRVVCPYSEVKQLSLESTIHTIINDINEALCVVAPLQVWN